MQRIGSEAYIDFLQSGAILPDASNQGLQIQDADAATYGIVDVNLDGIPELFLFPGCADWRYDLYTYYNGTVKLVDCSASATSLFLYNLEGTHIIIWDYRSLPMEMRLMYVPLRMENVNYCCLTRVIIHYMKWDFRILIQKIITLKIIR